MNCQVMFNQQFWCNWAVLIIGLTRKTNKAPTEMNECCLANVPLMHFAASILVRV